MKLHLEEVTAESWQNCALLRVTPNQVRFVPTNLWALAETKFMPERIPLGIYDDDTLVGMVVCSYDENSSTGRVHRLVIGEGFENRGYSTNTMQWLIRRFRRIPGCGRIEVSWHPQNTIIAEFYKSYGFRETGGLTSDGETVAALNIAKLREREGQADVQGESPDNAEPTSDDSSTGPSVDIAPASAWTRPVVVSVARA